MRLCFMVSLWLLSGCETSSPAEEDVGGGGAPDAAREDSGGVLTDTGGPVTGSWQFARREVWWVPPSNGSEPYTQIPDVPFGEAFSYGDTAVTYSGAEHEVTRTEVSSLGTSSITFTWDALPAAMLPGQSYAIDIEAAGTTGNGILLYRPVGLEDPLGDYYAASFRDGSRAVSLSLEAPSGGAAPQPVRFVVELASGAPYYVHYWYVYEWRPG